MADFFEKLKVNLLPVKRLYRAEILYFNESYDIYYNTKGPILKEFCFFKIVEIIFKDGGYFMCRESKY